MASTSAGDGGDTGQWAPIFTALVEQTRTCAYDRAGVGLSDEAKGTRCTERFGMKESLVRPQKGTQCTQ